MSTWLCGYHYRGAANKGIVYKLTLYFAASSFQFVYVVHNVYGNYYDSLHKQNDSLCQQSVLVCLPLIS